MSKGRPYDRVAESVRVAGPLEERLRIVIDVLWIEMHPTGVSWVGFYIDQPDQSDDQRLILGPCRDKPACSPIGLHGVCGQALTTKKTRIVRDVKELGDKYVACDPRDQSEIAVPLINDAGVCWAVLDLDSHDLDAFDKHDDSGLRFVLKVAGLL